MPSKPGKDSKGYFYRWGSKGARYYYTKGDKASMAAAKAKADRQGRAAYAAGYKGNDMLQKITANFVGKVRHDSMEGDDYLVAPMVMLVEGVHDGSGGPLLYPEEEMAKTPQVWNHKPVIVYHPKAGGVGISACDPLILTNRKIGVIMNTTVSEVSVKDEHGKKIKRPALKAEAWLQENRMKKVDERIPEAIEKNQMMELSTGLFTDNESADEGAEWNGEKYIAIARNYRPDHLALLPDLKGACSIEDGAGFLRLNAKPDKIRMVGNSMSHGNIRSMLNSWLREKDEEVWVEDVYDTFFIYMKDGRYYKHNYSIKDNQITVEGDAMEVIRVTEWRTLTGEFVGNENEVTENDDFDRKENAMKEKEKIIDALIKNNTNSWGEDDRETLTKMDDAVLEKMQQGDEAAKVAVENAAKKGAEEATKRLTVNQEPETKETDSESSEDANKAEESADGSETGTVENEQKPKTTEEYIAEAPSEIRPALTNMLENHKAIKANLIKRITDNDRNKFSKEELEQKELPELKKLAAMLPDEKGRESDLEQNFEGLADVEDVTSNEEEPMVMPAVVCKA